MLRFLIFLFVLQLGAAHMRLADDVVQLAEEGPGDDANDVLGSRFRQYMQKACTTDSCALDYKLSAVRYRDTNGKLEEVSRALVTAKGEDRTKLAKQREDLAYAKHQSICELFGAEKAILSKVLMRDPDYRPGQAVADSQEFMKSWKRLDFNICTKENFYGFVQGLLSSMHRDDAKETCQLMVHYLSDARFERHLPALKYNGATVAAATLFAVYTYEAQGRERTDFLAREEMIDLYTRLGRGEMLEEKAFVVRKKPSNFKFRRAEVDEHQRRYRDKKRAAEAAAELARVDDPEDARRVENLKRSVKLGADYSGKMMEFVTRASQCPQAAIVNDQEEEEMPDHRSLLPESEHRKLAETLEQGFNFLGEMKKLRDSERSERKEEDGMLAALPEETLEKLDGTQKEFLRESLEDALVDRAFAQQKGPVVQEQKEEFEVQEAAQRPEPVVRKAVLIPHTEGDAEGRVPPAALIRGLPADEDLKGRFTYYMENDADLVNDERIALYHEAEGRAKTAGALLGYEQNQYDMAIKYADVIKKTPEEAAARLQKEQKKYDTAVAALERAEETLFQTILQGDEDYAPGRTGALVQDFMQNMWQKPGLNICSRDRFAGFLQGLLKELDPETKKKICLLGEKIARKDYEQHFMALKYNAPVVVVAVIQAILKEEAQGKTDVISGAELSAVYKGLAYGDVVTDALISKVEDVPPFVARKRNPGETDKRYNRNVSAAREKYEQEADEMRKANTKEQERVERLHESVFLGEAYAEKVKHFVTSVNQPPRAPQAARRRVVNPPQERQRPVEREAEPNHVRPTIVVPQANQEGRLNCLRMYPDLDLVDAPTAVHSGLLYFARKGAQMKSEMGERVRNVFMALYDSQGRDGILTAPDVRGLGKGETLLHVVDRRGLSQPCSRYRNFAADLAKLAHMDIS